MTIRPYRFKLKQVSEHEQRLLEALFAYLPATGLRSLFRRGLVQALTREIGVPCALHLETVRQESYEQFLSRLPDPALLAVVGMAPIEAKAILDIDAPLAMTIVERLLGGEGRRVPEPRPLSDTEQGVFEYLLLKAMAEVHDLCGDDARVHFRFERFAMHPHEVRELAAGDEGMALLVFRLQVGERTGFVRLVLPDPFVEGVLLDVEGVEERRPGERAERLQRLRRFGFLRVPLWAEAGRTVLTPAELAQLEEGDVVLFDESLVRLDGGRPTGKCLLRVGAGLAGGYEAELQTDADYARLTLTGVHKGA